MATRLKDVDAVMVGMGWTGAILAREFTKAGLSVVGLERGLVKANLGWTRDKGFLVRQHRLAVAAPPADGAQIEADHLWVAVKHAARQVRFGFVAVFFLDVEQQRLQNRLGFDE